MPSPSSPVPSAHLFLGASWALSHGDAGGLAQVVADLAQGFTGELQRELRKELLELSSQCHVDYDSAAERWPVVCARAQAVLQPAHPKVMSQTESSSEPTETPIDAVLPQPAKTEPKVEHPTRPRRRIVVAPPPPRG